MSLRAVSNAFDAMHAAAEAPAPAVAAPAPAPAEQGLRAVSNAFDAMHAALAAEEDAAAAAAASASVAAAIAVPVVAVEAPCIAKLAAAYHQALYAYRENPTEENKVALEAAHRERFGGSTFKAAFCTRYTDPRQ